MTTKKRDFKRKRAMLWLGVVGLVSVLAVVAWVSPLRWTIIGRLNHENFHRGKPTSYWREQLKGEDGSLRQLWHDAKNLITLAPRSKRIWEVLSVGGPTAVPVLVDLLRDEDNYVRFWAAQSLRQLTMRKEPAVREDVGSQVQEVVSCLIEALHDNQDGVRMTAAGILHNIGPEAKAAVPGLIKALQDKNAGVRMEAAVALGEIGLQPGAAKAAIPPLIEALKDKSDSVRELAASSLGVIQPNAMEAIPALIETLKEEQVRVRNAAAGALCNLGERKEAIPILIEALKSENDRISDCAATVMGLIGTDAQVAFPSIIGP